MSGPSETVKVDVEDNFDDFDDVLDEFNTSSSSLVPPSSNIPAGTRARTNTCVDQAPPKMSGPSTLGDVKEDDLTSDFARELAKGMENLMKELGTEAGVKDGEPDEEKDRILKAAWEAMLVEGLNGDVESLGTPYKPEDASKPPPAANDFQSKIQETMRKLKEGDGPQNDPDMESLEAMLKELGMGDGEGNDEQIATMLETMMGQLMTKEILYDPLKELNDKYPGYLANPPEPLSAEDKTRYEAQLVAVAKVVKVFEDPKYDDNNALEMKKVVDLMSEIQSYGSPPESVMGPLPPGLGFGSDGMPQLPNECCII